MCIRDSGYVGGRQRGHSPRVGLAAAPCRPARHHRLRLALAPGPPAGLRRLAARKTSRNVAQVTSITGSPPEQRGTAKMHILLAQFYSSQPTPDYEDVYKRQPATSTWATGCARTGAAWATTCCCAPPDAVRVPLLRAIIPLAHHPIHGPALAAFPQREDSDDHCADSPAHQPVWRGN